MNDKKDSFTISNCLVISESPERGLSRISMKLNIFLVLKIIILIIFTFYMPFKGIESIGETKLKNNIQLIKEVSLIDLRICIG